MFNRSLVLVATDDPATAERTIGVAFSIAKQSGGEVHALRVISHDGAPYANDLWDAPALAFRHDLGADIGSRLLGIEQSAERDGVRLREVTLRGEPEHVVPAYGQLHEAAVLVVERDYGSSRFWRNAGVVRELARRSPAPILVLPPSGRTFEAGSAFRVNHILVPVDFSIASAVAVKTALGLARRHGSRLTLLHAIENVPNHMVFSGSEAWRLMQRVPAQTRAIAQQLRRDAAMLGADEVEAQAVTGKADNAILDLTTQSDADLVVMGVAPRSWLHRTVFGSTLDRVLRRMDVPVLVLPVVAGAHEWLNAPDNDEIGSGFSSDAAFDRRAA
jgi:nucleotide-binding universal stress UspA family protein